MIAENAGVDGEALIDVQPRLKVGLLRRMKREQTAELPFVVNGAATMKTVASCSDSSEFLSDQVRTAPAEPHRRRLAVDPPDSAAASRQVA